MEEEPRLGIYGALILLVVVTTITGVTAEFLVSCHRDFGFRLIGGPLALISPSLWCCDCLGVNDP